MLKKLINIGILSIIMVLCFSALVLANGGGFDENYQIDEITGQGSYYFEGIDDPFSFEIELRNFDSNALTIDVKGEMEADKVLFPIADADEDADLKVIIYEQAAKVGEYFIAGPYGSGFIVLAEATLITHVGGEDIAVNEMSIPFLVYDGDQLGEDEYLGQLDYFGILLWGFPEDIVTNGNIITTWDYLEP